MKYPNLISTTIPDKDLEEILNAFSFINDKLSELVTLSREELDALPKMGKETISFVQDSLKEAETHFELIPDDIEIDEIKKDVDLINSINQILNPLNTLQKKLENSALVAGSEAYLPSLAIYNAMKADAIRKKKRTSRVKI